MRIHVRLIQKDLLNQEEKVIADSVGILTGKQLLYQELETKAKHSVQFLDNKVLIKRKAEVASDTELVLNEIGKSIISSEFGNMELQTKLEKMSQSDDLWMVEYAIISEHEVVSKYLMKWELDKLS